MAEGTVLGVPRPSAVVRAVIRAVETCRRHARLVVVATLLVSALLGWYAARHLAIDTDTNHLISEDLPWRQREKAFDAAFPQNIQLIAVVVDAPTPDQAEDAATALAKRLETQTGLFKTVRRPDGGEFFQREGLLFLSVEEVQKTVDQIISAQPLIGTLAADPTLRGVFDALGLALQGVTEDEIELSDLEAPLNAIASAVESVLQGRPRPVSWQNLFTGRQPMPQELRRFILVQPVLNYDALQPGARASAAIRESARELGLTPDNGVRVRLTGSVPLSDEEFASLAEGAGLSTAISLGLVGLLLYLAMHSWRIIVAALTTLLVGLVATAAFACAAVGALNLISVAFAVLFVGLAVDFSIQFCVRYRDERYRAGTPEEALHRAAATLGAPLLLAAATTAVGFYSFVPTAYSGVSELGVIAGTSMIIAIALNLTLLPALLTLLRPRGEPEPVGYERLAVVDHFLLTHRRGVIGAASALGLVGLALAPSLHFDFNPLNLKDPHTESVSTLFDLMSDPSTTPYTIDALLGSEQEAQALADRVEKLPEVAQVATVASFVPDDQEQKLAILADAALLLGPTLSPPTIKPPPDDAAILAAIRKCVERLREAAAKADKPGVALRLADLLERAVERGASVLPGLRATIIAGLPERLASLRLALDAQPVTLETLPEDLRRAWVTPDGRARIEVFPKGDARDNQVLRRFVAAVRALAPEATGTPVSIQESGATVVTAFTRAGIIALVAITLLLFLVLRRVRDVALVLAPLLLGALLTVATSVAIGLPLNFANIIALPLLLGIGVAFDIYFVMNWRAGLGPPLQSSTARAVIFSALVTTCAFGSLALSSHPGTSEMGKLLTLSLAYTLLSTLFVLPALLGPPRR